MLLSFLCTCGVLPGPGTMPLPLLLLRQPAKRRITLLQAMLGWREPFPLPGALSSMLRLCLGVSQFFAPPIQKPCSCFQKEPHSSTQILYKTTPIPTCLTPSTSGPQNEGARLKQKPLLSSPQQLEKGLENLTIHHLTS